VLLKSGDLPDENIDENILSAAPVADGNGNIVPLGVLAEIETRLGPVAIQRIERQRSVTLQVTPPDEMPFETAIRTISEKADQAKTDGSIPAGVDFSLGGSAGKLIEAQKQFAWILILAFIISFFLLAGLFEDF